MLRPARVLLAFVLVIGSAGSGAPNASVAADQDAPAAAAQAKPSPPAFDLDVTMKPVADTRFTSAAGLVKFRQRDERVQEVQLDVSVRGLAPNTHYKLERAVDQALDGNCTGTEWLALGADNKTPRDIVTDAKGAGSAQLTRNLAAFPRGTAFDIHFRVIGADGGAVVLESGCYSFTVR